MAFMLKRFENDACCQNKLGVICVIFAVEAHRNGSKSDEEVSPWTKTRTAIHEFHNLQLHVLPLTFNFKLSKTVLRRNSYTLVYDTIENNSFARQELNLSPSHCGHVGYSCFESWNFFPPIAFQLHAAFFALQRLKNESFDGTYHSKLVNTTRF